MDRSHVHRDRRTRSGRTVIRLVASDLLRTVHVDSFADRRAGVSCLYSPQSINSNESVVSERLSLAEHFRSAATI